MAHLFEIRFFFNVMIVFNISSFQPTRNCYDPWIHIYYSELGLNEIEVLVQKGRNCKFGQKLICVTF